MRRSRVAVRIKSGVADDDDTLGLAILLALGGGQRIDPVELLIQP